MISFAIICTVLLWRKLLAHIVKKITVLLFTESYAQNILELLPGIRHIGGQTLLENNLRAASGDLLHRPMGSSKQWPHVDELTFIPAQTTPFPVDADKAVDVSVTIGKKANKPLTISIPVMISGMAYGIALSKKTRLALMQAANKVGTAINSGEGGILPEEINNANKFILQVAKTKWSKEDELFKKAEMIEVKLGQGALLGTGAKISPANLTGEARDILGLKEEEEAVIFENFFKNQTLKDVKELVSNLRHISGGVPIGVKIGAGGNIEEDIDHLIELGVDYIAIDGGQAATLGGPPLLADDIGIPGVHAIVRAVNYLEKRKMKEKISVIASGGLFTPSHILKMIALGADAVYLGSAMLFAVSHNETTYALPFEPPTQVVWNEGKFKNLFSIDEGAKSASNYLTACAEEIKIALRAMGKTSLRELSIDDLVSFNKNTANTIGIPYSFHPWPTHKKSGLNE